MHFITEWDIHMKKHNFHEVICIANFDFNLYETDNPRDGIT